MVQARMKPSLVIGPLGVNSRLCLHDHDTRSSTTIFTHHSGTMNQNASLGNIQPSSITWQQPGTSMMLDDINRWLGILILLRTMQQETHYVWERLLIIGHKQEEMLCASLQRFGIILRAPRPLAQRLRKHRIHHVLSPTSIRTLIESTHQIQQQSPRRIPVNHPQTELITPTKTGDTIALTRLRAAVRVD